MIVALPGLFSYFFSGARAVLNIAAEKSKQKR